MGGKSLPCPFSRLWESVSNVLGRGSPAVGNVGRWLAAELKLLCFTGAACAHDGA